MWEWLLKEDWGKKAAIWLPRQLFNLLAGPVWYLLAIKHCTFSLSVTAGTVVMCFTWPWPSSSYCHADLPTHMNTAGSPSQGKIARNWVNNKVGQNELARVRGYPETPKTVFTYSQPWLYFPRYFFLPSLPLSLFLSPNKSWMIPKYLPLPPVIHSISLGSVPSAQRVLWGAASSVLAVIPGTWGQRHCGDSPGRDRVPFPDWVMGLSCLPSCPQAPSCL